MSTELSERFPYTKHVLLIFFVEHMIIAIKKLVGVRFHVPNTVMCFLARSMLVCTRCTTQGACYDTSKGQCLQVICLTLSLIAVMAAANCCTLRLALMTYQPV
jgi:hypothetical protein